MENNYVALKVGTEFIIDELISENQTDYVGALVTKSDSYVRVHDTLYPLYSGATYADSQKIDKLIDSGDYEIYKVAEHLVDVTINDN